MRTVFALAAVLTGSLALAQNDKPQPVPPPSSTQPTPAPKPATPPPAGQPTTPTPTPPSGQPGTPPPAVATPVPPPAAKPPVPVPDMPVISTKELDGGLIVEEMKIGDGYEVKAGGAVVAYYHGTLKADGKVFQSAFESGEPVPFPLNGVIEGWQKGLPGIKVGGVRKLTIPAKMAYGEQGRPGIPANSDLVFIIQIVDALQMDDVTEGKGEDAGNPCVAVTAYSMKDKDGKEIEKADAKTPYIWIPGEMQIGPNSRMDTMQVAMMGMKVGGKRKIVVPKEFNNANPSLGLTRPSGVPLTVELELIAVRNLPGAQHAGAAPTTAK